MAVLKFLLEKEMKQLFRNPIFIGVLVFYIILVLLIFPYAINYDLKKFPIAIVNQDGGSYSHRLISKIEGTPAVEIAAVLTNYDDAMDLVEQQKALAILVLQKGFTESLDRADKPAEVQLQINAVDGVQSSIAMGYLQEIVTAFQTELGVEEKGIQPSLEQSIIKPIYRYNTTLNYRFFMLPALIVVLITMFSGVMPAVMIVNEKEQGTLQQINVTPIKRHLFILGKIIPYWLVVQVALLFAVGVIGVLHGLHLESSYFLLAFSAFVFTIALNFLAVLISNFAETLQQAMFIMLFFILIFFLISGLFTPVNAMPIWAQAIAYANPLTYFNEITRMLYLKGSTFIQILPQLAMLLLFGLLFGVIAIATNRKRS